MQVITQSATRQAASKTYFSTNSSLGEAVPYSAPGEGDVPQSVSAEGSALPFLKGSALQPVLVEVSPPPLSTKGSALRPSSVEESVLPSATVKESPSPLSAEGSALAPFSMEGSALLPSVEASSVPRGSRTPLEESSSLLELVKKAQELDLQCRWIISQLRGMAQHDPSPALLPRSVPQFHMIDGGNVLRFIDHVLVPAQESLQDHIMELYHDSPSGGHWG